MELSADDDVTDESAAVGGFIPAVPPSVVQVAASSCQDSGQSSDEHLSWHLPADLGVVQGAADSLGPLLMTVLRGLRS